MPSMTTYQPGDILLVNFPFSGSAQRKARPALVVLDTGDADILVARVTTQGYQTPHDVPVTDWQKAGLLAPSVVRLHKLATIEKALVQRRLGAVQPADRQAIASVLRQFFKNW
jgi:mRNA interferase MazF